MMNKVVIIGGSAGGMTAATRLRRLNETLEIVVLEKGEYVSYANCGLPYALSGEVKERHSLILHTPEALKKRYGLDIRTGHTATRIDPGTRTVSVTAGDEAYTETYDALLLATGAAAIRPDIKGLADCRNAFFLQTIPDMDAILEYIKANNVRQAAVIGGGPIGLEVTENLTNRGIGVTVLEAAAHILPRMDEEMASFIQTELSLNGVEVRTGAKVKEIAEDGHLLVLGKNKRLPTDMILISAGVRSRTDLAETAGIELHGDGGILVDEHYLTSVPDIYAIGDVIMQTSAVSREDVRSALATHANRQGRQVADILMGYDRERLDVLGTSIVRVFNETAASTGLTEEEAATLRIPCRVIHVSGTSHASYYPGATPLLLKLLFDAKTGEILGAAAIGEDGADKRIDVISAAIKGGLTVFDLPDLELSYAPPFGTPKDVVNMLGYVAMDQIEEISDSIQWYDLPACLKDGCILIDVRTPEEYAEGSIKDSRNIPLETLRGVLATFDRDKDYIVYCRTGSRSYLAERIMRQAGLTVRNLDGAFLLYESVRPGDIMYPEED